MELIAFFAIIGLMWLGFENPQWSAGRTLAAIMGVILLLAIVS